MANRESVLHETEQYRCLVYNQRQTEDIYLTMCGIESLVPGKEFHAPAERPGYHLHIILRGKGILRVNGEYSELHMGQMFITKPGEDSWYKPDQDDPWAYCWMTYDGRNARIYTESAGFTKGVNVLNCNLDGQEFYNLVKRILDQPELTLANDLMRLGILLEYLGLAVKSNYESVNIGRFVPDYTPDVYVDYAVNYIRGNYTTAKVSDVARYIGVHRSYLTSIFKKKMGISPQEYLMQCKLNMARRLLTETELPIQDISYRVGYANPLTFSKVFKNEYGISPKHFRDQQADGNNREPEGDN